MEISYSDLLRPLSKSETSILSKGQLGKIYKRAPRLYKAAAIQSYLRIKDPGFLPSTAPDLHTDSCFKGKDGGFYSGQLDEKHRRHGLGLLVHPDGSIYYGFFKNGILRGQGRKFSHKGDIYVGEWKNDCIKGIGSIIYAQKKEEYTGELANNVPSGKGTLAAENRFLYVGEFKNGLKHGKGKCLWPDGSSYEGDFEYSQLQGNGRFTFANGDEYSGEWRNNIIEGRGCYRWAEGSWYYGEYHNGLREGFGELYSEKIYCGYWEKGKCDGIGVEINEKKEVLEGIWKKGNLTIPDSSIPHEAIRQFKMSQILITENLAEFLCDFSDIEISESLLNRVKEYSLQLAVQYNNKVQCEWAKRPDCLFKGQVNSQGSPHGVGVSLSDDVCYQGFFNNGQKSGFGREIFSDGSVFQGYWRKDLRHGFGVLIDHGVFYVGDWVCGQLMSENDSKPVLNEDSCKDRSVSPDISSINNSIEDSGVSEIALESVLDFN